MSDVPIPLSGIDPDGNLLIREDENDTETFTRFDAVNRAIAVRVFRFGQTDSHTGDPLFAPAPVDDFANPSAPVAMIGTTKQDFQYDGLSRLTQATDNNDPATAADDSTVTQAYDSLSRVLEESQLTGTITPMIVSSAWRAENLRSALTYPNNRQIVYTYDQLDRSQLVRDPSLAQPFADYDYIGDRVLQRRNLMNSTRLTFVNDAGTAADGYDGNQRVVQQRHRRGNDTLIVGFGHSYDRMDNKNNEDKLHNHPQYNNNEVYGKDSAYRLKSFTRPNPGARTPLHSQFTLDGVGNWKQVDAEARRHSSFNEVTQRGAINFQSDDNGNTTNDGTYTFAFDFQNRLRRVRTIAGGVDVGVYSYDALGRRSRSVRGAVTRDFALDGAHEIEEREANVTKVQYVFGGRVDEPLVYEKNLDGTAPFDPVEDRLYYHENTLGSVVALTNGNGTVKEGYLYDAYGKQTVYVPLVSSDPVTWVPAEIAANGLSALGNPFLFTARRLDGESGLYYYRARHLDPVQGRFLQRDPMGFDAGDPNLYGYVGQDPTNATDAFGLAGDDPLWDRPAAPYRLAAYLGWWWNWDSELDQKVEASRTRILNMEAARIERRVPPPGSTLIQSMGSVVPGFQRDWKDYTQSAATIGAVGVMWAGSGGIFVSGSRFTFNFQTGRWTNQTAGRAATAQEVAAVEKAATYRFPVTAAKWPKGVPAQEGLRLVDSARRSLKVDPGRNIAFAEVHVDGSTTLLTGVSGKVSPPGTVPVVTSPRFTTRPSGAMTRAHDSEVKILEDIAKDLAQNARGTISLFTERGPCFSCQGVIQQFEKMFTNVKVIVTHGGR